MKYSELRKDLVSGDWIVIAPRRGIRPHEITSSQSRRKVPKAGCVFEDPEQVLLEYRNRKQWSIRVIANKFPAFMHRDICPTMRSEGPYKVTDGVGHHEVVVTRDHNADFPDLSLSGAREVFQSFRDRYCTLKTDPCIAYISMFHNWGSKAGASVYHPHYQTIAIPVVPPDFQHSLKGSLAYAEEHHTCVHCAMIAWEKRKKKRIVFENKEAIAFTPFVSRSAFEIRVFPKRHSAFFEDTREAVLGGVAEALHAVLRMMKRSLHDPDYNFFIHTAPVHRATGYGNYHWHIEILPKMNIEAGFELGTGIEINPVDPDDAARLLRKK